MSKKRKGPSQPQPYAVRMAATKKAISDQERQAILHHCLVTIYQASAVALNEGFGFDTELIERFRDKLNDTLLEFGVLQDDVDTDYAVGVLERRYKQIMREEQDQ